MAKCPELSKIQISFPGTYANNNSTNNDIKSITSEMMCVLEIEDSENKDQIVNDLLENGRQVLAKYQEDIIPDIYIKAMDGNESSLIILLKRYFQQQWETQYAKETNQWFKSFLEENRDLYERILTRTAEYGTKFMKDCPILSIVLQILFESIDDQCLKETSVFDNLWLTVTTNGLKSINEYSEYIVPDVMNEQLNRSKSTLFQALRVYYCGECENCGKCEKLFCLLQKHNIQDRRNLYESALDNVAEHGWLLGVEQIKQKVTPRSYSKLLENLHLFLQQRKVLKDVTSNPSENVAMSTNTQPKETLPKRTTTSDEKQATNKSADPFINFQSILTNRFVEYKVPLEKLGINEITHLLYNQKTEALTQIRDLLKEDDYISFCTKFLKDPQVIDIWNGKKCSTEAEGKVSLLDQFKNELKLLWIKYRIDNDLDFNCLAQQLFDEDMKALEEIKDYMLADDFTQFEQELIQSERLKEIWKVKKQSKAETTIEDAFAEFKAEMKKLLQDENLPLNKVDMESLLQELYENKDKNIAIFFKNILPPKRIKQLIVKIQLNTKLKALWISNMFIFSNMKSIVEKYITFTNDSDGEVYKIISELYVDPENGMKLIARKCTPENFNKIKSDLYENVEIGSKVFQLVNVTTSKINDNIQESSSSLIQTQNIRRLQTMTSGEAHKDRDQLSTEIYKNEPNIVLSCVFPQSELLQLEYLVQAGELQFINQTLKNISERLVDEFHRKRCTFPEFIQNCLIPIMYFLKRLQNLDDFMYTLTSKYRRIQQQTNQQSTDTTNLSLRMLLHVLLMSSDIFLRRIIISLVSKRNPVPFISPNIENWNQNEQYEIMSAIIHVWDYTRPTILSFGIGRCEGKSILLNQLFQSTFEQSVKSIYFQQTIDIDFGYCFNPKRAINIADTHGTIDKRLLSNIRSLFDGFLIQIDKTTLDQHPKLLLEYIEQLPPDKFQMIIVRDTPPQNLQECSLLIKNLIKQTVCESPQKIHIYPLINISNTNDRDSTDAIEYLREEIIIKIKEEIPRNDERQGEVLPCLQKLMKKDYVKYLTKINKIIQPLKNRLLEGNKCQNHQNFPLYIIFQELCKIRQTLKKLGFHGTENENMFEINRRVFELESALDPNTKTSRPIKCGFVFDSFIEILKSEHMLMSLDLLATELKRELSNLGDDKIAGDMAVENAFLSLEVLWRNSVVCYDHTNNENQCLIIKSYHEFISAGFPFEIIDGDNFHFQHKFLAKILDQFTSERILVISIIGPQNSGKSTLLNYMFGTLFDVREGRCTRGIYGSLVKLAKSDQTSHKNLPKDLSSKLVNINYIMLIDTEGLLAIEKGDKEYDRRLVLFALAVSHLVIVNMMGDINETLKDMLTLSADSLKEIGVNRVHQPTVHFVLNQKADPILNNHMEAINKIVKDLDEQDLGTIIDISREKFHTLPSAFKKERKSTDNKSPCFLRTEPDFIESTQQLREKIIQSALSCYERYDQIFTDLPQWLQIAVNIFDILQKFPDLTYFKDINERQQDNRIRREVSELIKVRLSATYRKQMIKDTCELAEHEIRKHFKAKFDAHQDDFDNDLENIFRMTSASDRIRDRCRQFLKRQITEISNAWCTAAIQAHDQR